MSLDAIRKFGLTPVFAADDNSPEALRQAAGIQAQLIGLVKEHDSAIADLAADRRFTPEGKRDRHRAIVHATLAKLKTIARGFRERFVDPHNRLGQELRSVVTSRTGPGKPRSELQLFTQRLESLEATIREDRILNRFEKLDKVARVKLLQDAIKREDQQLLEAVLLAPTIGEDLVPLLRVRREAERALAEIKAPGPLDQFEQLHALVVPIKSQLRDVLRGLPKELGLDGLPSVRSWLAEVNADEQADNRRALDEEAPLFPVVTPPTVPELEAPLASQAD